MQATIIATGERAIVRTLTPGISTLVLFSRKKVEYSHGCKHPTSVISRSKVRFEEVNIKGGNRGFSHSDTHESDQDILTRRKSAMRITRDEFSRYVTVNEQAELGKNVGKPNAYFVSH